MFRLTVIFRPILYRLSHRMLCVYISEMFKLKHFIYVNALGSPCVHSIL